ncbi:MAG: antibiotic biosynthesis monooxygenase [Candidatus Thiothrix singaporensis]|uniref:Antibiotic biosynthesis monooxygenase n=1 Tax=Candidatus Thiothrix singaporensis TaxID=2799669 RepID=A0A7L6AWZ9_9GAMM|nr:MAG: antibiotic biosynthesis monooxygenase [Candidatus Thiothrix singaporensis]
MYVVIFRAQIRELDGQYSTTAARMRELALTEFGCLAFHTVSEGQEEIALSYWPDEASIQAWKNHPEHLLAQQLGRDRWYASYRVEVAQITRQYAAKIS